MLELNSLLVLLTGALLGAAVLAAALRFGLRVKRRGPEYDPAQAQQDERVSSLLQSIFQWTGSFSDEIKQYRSTLGDIDEHCRGETAQSTRPGEMPGAALAQIVEANERLQARLSTAEAALRNQGEEIASYLTEARTDPLTGLPNRRAFDAECLRRHREWQRYGHSYAVVVLDVDNFKQFNDRHGHLVGDKVLCEVAGVLRSVLRETDFAARFGGEEFALVLPVTTLGDAGNAAERVRQAILAASVDHDAQNLRITVSCGAAQALHSENNQALFKRADQALYAAKRNGRNQSWFHDGIRCISLTRMQTAPGSPAVRPVSSDLQAACVDLRKRLMEVAGQRPPAKRN